MEQGFERFLGYADLYDEGRPSLPNKTFEMLRPYIRDNMDLIVDIGCGTGLSTKTCEKYAKKVIGIDPSEDLLNEAKKKDIKNVSFIRAFSDNTGLDGGIADLVICSQAFHWMNPTSTLKEVNRILKKGGMFAVVDADYPPVINVRLEKLNVEIHKYTSDFENDEKAVRYPKNQHLKNIINSKYFEYCREICFESETEYDKERFKKFLLSQSSMQKAIRNHYDKMKERLDEIDKVLDEVFMGRTLKAYIPYKIVIGIK